MSDRDITNFPLSWPNNSPRTDKAQRKHAAFTTRNRGMSYYGPSRKHSVAESAGALEDEIKRMKGRNMVISSNLKVKGNGFPYSGQKTPADPGVAVYFEWEKRDLVFACDKWLTVEDNLWAIVKHIEALRGQERWGVGSLDQAFAGYAALPDPNGRKWWEVFNVPAHMPTDEVKTQYKRLAMQYHPDNQTTGSAETFHQIQTAFEDFKRERGL